jgi:thioredoxin-related protein
MANSIRRCLGAASLVLTLALALAAGCSRPSTSTPKPLGYLPPVSAAQAYEDAKRQAAAGGKRILIIAGGDWCRWCHVLDRFLRERQDINETIGASFVTLKLEVGENGTSAEVLDKLPTAAGYPHFWVLSAEGQLIASIDTASLEQGQDDYDATAFRRFVQTYAPAAK